MFSEPLLDGFGIASQPASVEADRFTVLLDGPLSHGPRVVLEELLNLSSFLLMNKTSRCDLKGSHMTCKLITNTHTHTHQLGYMINDIHVLFYYDNEHD